MGKKIVIFVGILIFIIAVAVLAISRFVKVTGPLIWIDRSSRGSWQTSANSAAWWEELSILNPNMIDQSRRVVVYLLPTLQESKVAFGRKNQPPTLFADWRIWGKEIQVLTVSVNWGEWEAIEAADRDKQLTQFVASALAKYWGATTKDASVMIDRVLRGEVETPIQLTWKHKGGE